MTHENFSDSLIVSFGKAKMIPLTLLCIERQFGRALSACLDELRISASNLPSFYRV